MSKLLEQAFEEVSRLPEKEQEAFATWILEELKSERRWAERFAQSHEVIERLGREALQDFREGRTEQLDPDRL